jgi:hypothetical protein
MNSPGIILLQLGVVLSAGNQLISELMAGGVRLPAGLAVLQPQVHNLLPQYAESISKKKLRRKNGHLLNKRDTTDSKKEYYNEKCFLTSR